MGRTGAAQRQKKAEKAKVKLKGHTTKFLPKGKNITNTTFKVRKIVLQQQLKTPDETQPLTTRKLNLKEVLSRLQHYSSTQRQEGLYGLAELLGQMDSDQLHIHLSSILDSLAKLSLDGETTVRRQSANILASVLSSVKEAQLLPFGPVLGSYLSCAMTHIQLGVQEDSLLLFDALLEYAPTVAACSADQLLPCVLDMISRSRSDHQAGRQLSVQLSSSLTSTIWRAKVFGRLQALLIVFLQQYQGQGKFVGIIKNEAHLKCTTVTGDTLKDMNFPLYYDHYSSPMCLDQFFHQRDRVNKNTKTFFSDEAQIRAFAESIMPLLFDAWMEVSPSSTNKSNSGNLDGGLEVEHALLLHSVLEIISLIWQYLVLWENENGNHMLTDWFKRKFSRDLKKCLGDEFPYAARFKFTIEEESGKGRKSLKSKTSKVTQLSVFHLAAPFLLKDKDEESCSVGIANCVLQNLTLCHLLVNIIQNPSPDLKDKIIGIMIKNLSRWKGGLLSWSDHLLRAVKSIFDRSNIWKCDLNPLLSAIVSRYYWSTSKQSASHKHFASQLNGLLGEVAMSRKYQHLQRYSGLSSWITGLPASLSKENVTVDKLCLLNKLACQNNKYFLGGLQSSFSSLLDAISSFQVLEGENGCDKEVGLASLFHWVQDWTDQQILSLRNVFESGRCPASLRQKIESILLLKNRDFQLMLNVEAKI